MKEGKVYVNSGAFCQSQYRKGYDADSFRFAGIVGVEKVTYSRVRRGGEDERETKNLSPSFLII